MTAIDIRIELGNAAMDSAADIADALRREVLPLLDCNEFGGPIHDRNGNTVGKWGLGEYPPIETPSRPGATIADPCDHCGLFDCGGECQDTETCPRCGGETIEAELTYSGCKTCQEELATIDNDGPVLGHCVHGVDLDRQFCPHGCRV